MDRDVRFRLVSLTYRLLVQRKPVTTRYIVDTYGVSLATAKRDLVLLETALPVLCDLTDTGAPCECKTLIYAE